MTPKPGGSTARGYGAKHQAERAKWKPLVESGRVTCWRCGKWLDPSQPWDLGHDDNDRTLYRGPECRRCNRAEGGRKRHRVRRVVDAWRL